MDIKLYPKTSKDVGGIKFYFDHQDKHFTIRPAGKPILLLEAKFKQLGGTDFMGAYDSAKLKTQHNEHKILITAVEHVNDFLQTLELVGQMGKAPFVVYIKERNDFKS